MRHMRRCTGAIVGTVFLVALAIGTTAEAQEESRELDLTPSRDSGVSGTAAFEDGDGGVEAKLNIEGAPEGDVEHLAHIHQDATCRDDRNDQGGPVEFPLETITAKDDGTGSSTTALEGTSVSQLFESGKERYVNIHAKEEGGGVPPGIACADLISMGGESTAGERTTAGQKDTGRLPGSGGISPISGLPATAALISGAIVAFLALRRINT